MPGPYTYLATIPQPGDLLSSSQPQILTNFASIKSLIDVDHVDFNSSDAGKHNQVTFPVQLLTPSFSGTEYGLWNETDGAVNQLWLNNPANLHFAQVPMAASTFNTVANPVPFSSCYSVIPSGFIMQWGSFVNQTTGALISFGFTFPTACILVIVSPTNTTSVALSSYQYHVSSFVVQFAGGGVASGTFFAIGY
jgi:hypothetical protein